MTLALSVHVSFSDLQVKWCGGLSTAPSPGTPYPIHLLLAANSPNTTNSSCKVVPPLSCARAKHSSHHARSRSDRGVFCLAGWQYRM